MPGARCNEDAGEPVKSAWRRILSSAVVVLTARAGLAVRNQRMLLDHLTDEVPDDSNDGPSASSSRGLAHEPAGHRVVGRPPTAASVISEHNARIAGCTARLYPILRTCHTVRITR